ncbi:LysR family transcriptional regulator [Saccharospirillum salsuginis]|uniref:LysR family transcriptional regulator n=1 Tax=Saccharospirillum salsuginis TaxID=418750 RepID=A0A918KPX2_9GAMM|nr:LysR family transcriptional regulator [Saccharospirillum salsuginis]GGX69920.1 LysR family transcriptional regulator [Saccharospirillum salsuginis]
MDSSHTWDLYRSLLAVVREGSLSAAARRIGLTQPTVGRHIDALESALGTALFSRHRNGLTPTEAALALVPHAEAMETAAAALVREASGTSQIPEGTVRITASEVVGSEIVPGLLVPFRQSYPGITVELATSDQVNNLLVREADIAIRMVRPVQEALVAKRIGQVPVGLFAHRHYLARMGEPCTMEDLRRHTLIGFDRDETAYRAIRSLGIPLDRDVFSFRSDSNAAQMAAVRAGLGIGGMQSRIARQTPDLCPVLSEAFHFDLEMWLVMHEDLRSVHRVRLLYDHLAESLKPWVS